MLSRNVGVRTSVDAIVAHWQDRFEQFAVSVDWEDARTHCWRCAHKCRSLHKCHIVPHSLSGKDEPSNLVLLCGRCHLENPNTDDPEFFWLWLKAHGKIPYMGCYETYWTVRGVEEFRRIFGREPFAHLGGTSIATPDVEQALKKLMGRVAKHFGENGLNPATVAWIMRTVEKAFEKPDSLAKVDIKNSLNARQVLAASMALNEDDRLSLAHELLQSLPPKSCSDERLTSMLEEIYRCGWTTEAEMASSSEQ